MHSRAAVVHEAIVWSVCAAVITLFVALLAFNIAARVFGKLHEGGPLAAGLLSMAASVGAFLLFNVAWPVQSLLH